MLEHISMIYGTNCTVTAGSDEGKQGKNKSNLLKPFGTMLDHEDDNTTTATGSVNCSPQDDRSSSTVSGSPNTAASSPEDSESKDSVEKNSGTILLS